MFGIDVMPFGAAFRAGLGGNLAFKGLRQFDRYDPRRNCDNSITNNHNQCRKQLTQVGLGRYVSVTDGGQRNNRPVDAFGYAGETVFWIFDKIDQATENGHQRQHDK